MLRTTHNILAIGASTGGTRAIEAILSLIVDRAEQIP